MTFARSTIRRSSTDTIVHAVGQRVYVNRSGSSLAHVELMNDKGTTAVASLGDGVEVMVMAWKPGGSNGTRYCVRSTGDGVEGWLAAVNLRRGRTVAPSPPALPAQAAPVSRTFPAARDPKARFGRR